MALIRCPIGFSEEMIAVFHLNKSQINTEHDKNNRIIHFSKISCIKDWNVERVNKERMCCPVGFYEEFIAVLLVKVSQIDTENDKSPKIFQFSKCLCIFSKFLTDIVDWNVKKGQHRKHVLSSRLFRRVISRFQVKIFQINRK